MFSHTYHPTPAVRLRIEGKSKTIEGFFENEFQNRKILNSLKPFGFKQFRKRPKIGLIENHNDLLVRFKQYENQEHETIRVLDYFKIRYNISESAREVEIYLKNRDLPFLKRLCTIYLKQVIHPLVYLKSLEKGFLLMHAAAVSSKEGVHVFPAQGGTGKTTLSLKLVDSGLNFYGDDLICISSDAKAYPYPRPLHLFREHIDLFNRLETIEISNWLKLKIYRNHIFRKILQPFFDKKLFLAVRARAEDIGIEVAKKPRETKSITFLSRDGMGGNIEDLIIKSSDFAGIDWKRFTSKDVGSKERKVLKEILENTTTKRTMNIEGWHELAPDDILSRLEEIIGSGEVS